VPVEFSLCFELRRVLEKRGGRDRSSQYACRVFVMFSGFAECPKEGGGDNSLKAYLSSFRRDSSFAEYSKKCKEEDRSSQCACRVFVRGGRFV
jgi:hypothetical protein